MYLGQSNHSAYDTSAGNIIYLMLFYAGIVIMALATLNSRKQSFGVSEQEQSRFMFLVAATAIGTAMGLIGGSFLSLARAGIFYQIHAICLIPALIERFRKEPYYLFLFYCIICLLLLPFTISLLRNFGDVVPYNFSIM